MPWGIDLDAQGDVYIADWRNDRIQKFTPDGDFLMAFGSSGSGEGEFNRPSSVAVDHDGIIYVADWMNNRLQVFDPDGNFVTMIEREKEFWGPIGVTVDDENRIFVCEPPRNRIQVYHKQSPTFVGPRL
jgi:sugar lactone lactonase YvrE